MHSPGARFPRIGGLIFMKQLQRMVALWLCLLLSAASLPPAMAEEWVAEQAATAVEIETTAALEPAPVEEAASAPSGAPREEEPSPTGESENSEPIDVPGDPEVTEVPDVSDGPTDAAEVPDGSGEAPAQEEPTESAPDATEVAGEGSPEQPPLTEEEPAPEDASVVDTTRSAAHSPDFVRGYVEVLGSAPGYADAEADAPILCVNGGVAYASARSGERLCVSFDGGDQIARAWISADQLRPMAGDEAQAFVLSCVSARRFFDDDPNLPLAALDYDLVPPPAPEMLLGATSLTLGAGEKVAVPVRFSDGQEHGLTYASSNARYAKVSADGVIQPLRYGKTATITVTSEFGQSAALKLSICKAPSKIDIQPARVDLCPGEVLTAEAKLSARSASAISWSSSDPAVATVDADGLVQAVAPGTAAIRGTTFNGRADAMQLTVHPDPESVRLSSAELILGVGELVTLTSVVAPDDFGGRVYRSSDPEVVEVDALTGSVRAIATGSATVTVETYNGRMADCAVVVKEAPSCIRLAETAIVLGVGERLPLPGVEIGEPGEDCAGSYTIKNKKTKYVTTTADGQVVGRRAGTVTIAFETYNGYSAALKVTIRRAPSKVSVSPAKAVLGVGERLNLNAKLNSGAAGSVTYSSSDPEVASVQPDGGVCALSAGSATITATTYNGRSAKCAIQVLNAPESIALGAQELTMGVGESYILTANLPEGSAGSYSFESDHPEVAAIDPASGKVAALAVGSAVMRVTAYNGASAACQLTVKGAPTGVAFQEKSVKLAVGDSYQLLPPTILGEDAGAASLRYKSGSSRLGVSASGLLTAKRTGKATITATTYNKKKASLSVTIVAAPKAISFAESELRMCVGMELAPRLNLGAASCNYSLTSSDPEVAAIAGDGRTIVARGGGSVTITATSYNGRIANLQLTVPPLPDSIALAPDRIVLGRGDSLALRAVMPEGQDSSLAYESSDPACASVDAEGVVSAVAPGAATIRVRTWNALEGECAVTVLEAPTRVELSPARAMRGVDEGQLQLEIRYGAENQGGRHAFSSSNPEVASVNQDGLVALHSPGTANITVQTYNGLSASCALTVGERPGEMYFEREVCTIALGDCVRLGVSFDRGCESHSFAVADARIASARGDELTGLAIGSTLLTATSHSGLTASCTLNVAPAPTGIELDQSEMKIVIGVDEAPALHARAFPDGVGSFRFTSSDPGVALVDAESGAITAVAAGDCVITATTYNGFSAECALQVRGVLDGVKIGIDPGHQAKPDYSREAIAPGKSSSKAKVSSGTGGVATHTAEHVVNLQVGLKLRDALEALGAEVYMTRTTADVNISNQERAKMMNALGVDLVLRIHCNGSSKNRSWNGMSIYVRKTGVGKEESARAASLILDAMAAETGAKNLGVKYSDTYTGLNWSTVPSMLMEMGYLSNAREDRLLNSPDYQDKLVAGMVAGICGYVDRPVPGAISEQ